MYRQMRKLNDRIEDGHENQERESELNDGLTTLAFYLILTISYDLLINLFSKQVSLVSSFRQRK